MARLITTNLKPVSDSHAQVASHHQPLALYDFTLLFLRLGITEEKNEDIKPFITHTVGSTGRTRVRFTFEKPPFREREI